MQRLWIFAVVLMTAFRQREMSACDWPQWRGPDRDGVARQSGLLAEWHTPPPVVWRSDQLGDGYAGVVVAEGRVFTLGRLSNNVFCTALDAETGRKLWSQQIGNSRRAALSTPTVSHGLVYALDPDGQLHCLKSHSGEIVWYKHLAKEFSGKLMSGRGYGESPLIDGDRLICTPGGAEALMVALHRQTGEVIWKTPQPSLGTKGRDGAAMSSAVVTDAAGRRQYVQLTGRGLVSVAADTGQFLWGYNDISNGTVNIPTPIVHGDFVFAANGYNAGSVLLQLRAGGATGVIAQEIYRLRGTDYQNHHGGSVQIGDHIYGGHGSNNGLPTCLELATGRILWKRRGPGSGSAAVLAADGHLLFRYQNGIVAWMDANPEGAVLRGTFEIPGAGGDSWSHPAIANGRLYLREQSTLWVYDLVNPGTANTAPPIPVNDARLSPELASVRSAGLRVEMLPVHEADWDAASHRVRFHRFAMATDDGNATRPAVITVSEDQLTADGMFRADVVSLLSGLSMPFVLNVGESQLNDAGLQQIAELPSLCGLNVELCSRLTDIGFSHLRKANGLRFLIATGTAITAKGLEPLSKLPHLAALDLETCEEITDEACVVLGRFPALCGLNLKKTAFEPVRISSPGLEHLGLLSRLQWLDLSANDVNDQGLRLLTNLRQLRELNLSLTGITDAGLAHLADLPELRRLNIMYTEGFAGPTITDTGMAHLLRLEKLQRLNLTGSRVTDVGLEQVAKLPKLQALELIKSGVTATGVAEFKRQRPMCTVRFNMPSAAVD